MTLTKAAGSAVISRKITLNQKAKQVNEISKIYGKKHCIYFRSSCSQVFFKIAGRPATLLKRDPKTGVFL